MACDTTSVKRARESTTLRTVVSRLSPAIHQRLVITTVCSLNYMYVQLCIEFTRDILVLLVLLKLCQDFCFFVHSNSFAELVKLRLSKNSWNKYQLELDSKLVMTSLRTVEAKNI